MLTDLWNLFLTPIFWGRALHHGCLALGPSYLDLKRSGHDTAQKPLLRLIIVAERKLSPFCTVRFHASLESVFHRDLLLFPIRFDAYFLIYV